MGNYSKLNKVNRDHCVQLCASLNTFDIDLVNSHCNFKSAFGRGKQHNGQSLSVKWAVQVIAHHDLFVSENWNSIKMLSRVLTTGSPKTDYVLSCLCDNACKGSVAICCKRRASCPVSRLLSSPIAHFIFLHFFSNNNYHFSEESAVIKVKVKQFTNYQRLLFVKVLGKRLLD